MVDAESVQLTFDLLADWASGFAKWELITGYTLSTLEGRSSDWRRFWRIFVNPSDPNVLIMSYDAGLQVVTLEPTDLRDPNSLDEIRRTIEMVENAPFRRARERGGDDVH